MVNTAASVLIDDERAVLDVIHGVYAAWAKNDADAFAALYTEHATVVQPGGVYKKNRGDVRTSIAQAFAGPLKGSTVIDEPTQVRLLGDDAAVVISEAGLTDPARRARLAVGRSRRFVGHDAGRRKQRASARPHAVSGHRTRPGGDCRA